MRSDSPKPRLGSVLRVLAGPARLGSTVGPLSWRVRVSRLLCPCWTAAMLLVPTESCLALQPSPLAATCVCFFQNVTVTQQETRLPLMSPISSDETVAQRGCKLFMQLPRMLLYLSSLRRFDLQREVRASLWSLCWGRVVAAARNERTVRRRCREGPKDAFVGAMVMIIFWRIWANSLLRDRHWRVRHLHLVHRRHCRRFQTLPKPPSLRDPLP